jgi:hypothetical protein
MSMHRMVIAALALVLLTSAARAEKPAAYEMSTEGEVQIAPDGHVSDYRVKGDLQPAVAELVKRNVMGWHFEPILVDGKPVIAKTAMHLSLHAEPVPDRDDEYSVHVTSISFGTPMRRGIGNPPRYPERAARARLGAIVVLSARLDEHGNVAEILPYQTSLDAHARSEKEAEKWRHEFEKAALVAAKTWQFDLTEIVGGQRSGAYVAIPVRFSISMSRTPRTTQWSAYEPGPIHPAPWAAVQGQERIAQLGNDDTISTSSRFHLKDDVIGKAL